MVGRAKIIGCICPGLRQLRFGSDPQGVGISQNGHLDLFCWIGGEGGKIVVGRAEIVGCICPGLRQLSFGVDSQSVGKCRNGLLDLIRRIGGEWGKIAVGSAEIVISNRIFFRHLRFGVDLQRVAVSRNCDSFADSWVANWQLRQKDTKIDDHSRQSFFALPVCSW